MLYSVNSDINRFFDANWKSTPVQYDGFPFVEPDDGRWISIKLVPYARESLGFGRGANKEDGLLKIFAYDASATRSYLLAEEAVHFIEETFIEGAFIDVGRGDGSGAIALKNNVYETLVLFNVRLFNGCQTSCAGVLLCDAILDCSATIK